MWYYVALGWFGGSQCINKVRFFMHFVMMRNFKMRVLKLFGICSKDVRW